MNVCILIKENKNIIMQILKESIKNEILKAASQEFNEKGFQAASMRRIAANAGITPGNIYRYFSSKEVLLNAVVTPIMTDLSQALMECTDGKLKFFTYSNEVLQKNEKFSIDIRKFSKKFIEINEKNEAGMSFISKNENYRNKMKEWLTAALNSYFMGRRTKTNEELVKIMSSIASISLIASVTECLRFADQCKKMNIEQSEIVYECITSIIEKEENRI